jgi:hypothetical protein
MWTGAATCARIAWSSIDNQQSRFRYHVRPNSLASPTPRGSAHEGGGYSGQALAHSSIKVDGVARMAPMDSNMSTAEVGLEPPPSWR